MFVTEISKWLKLNNNDVVLGEKVDNKKEIDVECRKVETKKLKCLKNCSRMLELRQ